MWHTYLLFTLVTRSSACNRSLAQCCHTEHFQIVCLALGVTVSTAYSHTFIFTGLGKFCYEQSIHASRHQAEGAASGCESTSLPIIGLVMTCSRPSAENAELHASGEVHGWMYHIGRPLWSTPAWPSLEGLMFKCISPSAALIIWSLGGSCGPPKGGNCELSEIWKVSPPAPMLGPGPVPGASLAL